MDIGQHFDRDIASELRIARAIDLTHPAGAEMRDDLVVRDPLTDAGSAAAAARRRSARRVLVGHACVIVADNVMQGPERCTDVQPLRLSADISGEYGARR